MNDLDRFLYEKINIDGLDTYVIAPKKCEELLADEAVLEELSIHKEVIERYIHTAKEVKAIKLYFAICYNTHVPKPFLGPVHCVQQDGKWYHVFYNPYWICRDCRHENSPVIRPLIEAESTYYAGLDRTRISTPDIFKHHRCEKCGHLLQGHLMKLDREPEISEERMKR